MNAMPQIRVKLIESLLYYNYYNNIEIICIQNLLA